MKETPASFYKKFIPQENLTVQQKVEKIHTDVMRDSLAALETYRYCSTRYKPKRNRDAQKTSRWSCETPQWLASKAEELTPSHRQATNPSMPSFSCRDWRRPTLSHPQNLQTFEQHPIARRLMDEASGGGALNSWGGRDFKFGAASINHPIYTHPQFLFYYIVYYSNIITIMHRYKVYNILII